MLLFLIGFVLLAEHKAEHNVPRNPIHVFEFGLVLNPYIYLKALNIKGTLERKMAFSGPARHLRRTARSTDMQRRPPGGLGFRVQASGFGLVVEGVQGLIGAWGFAVLWLGLRRFWVI